MPPRNTSCFRERGSVCHEVTAEGQNVSKPSHSLRLLQCLSGRLSEHVSGPCSLPGPLCYTNILMWCLTCQQCRKDNTHEPFKDVHETITEKLKICILKVNSFISQSYLVLFNDILLLSKWILGKIQMLSTQWTLFIRMLLKYNLTVKCTNFNGTYSSVKFSLT